MTPMRWTLLIGVLGIASVVYGVVTVLGDGSTNTGAFVTGAALLIGAVVSWRRLEDEG